MAKWGQQEGERPETFPLNDFGLTPRMLWIDPSSQWTRQDSSRDTGDVSRTKWRSPLGVCLRPAEGDWGVGDIGSYWGHQRTLGSGWSGNKVEKQENSPTNEEKLWKKGASPSWNIRHGTGRHAPAPRVCNQSCSALQEVFLSLCNPPQQHLAAPFCICF